MYTMFCAVIAGDRHQLAPTLNKNKQVRRMDPGFRDTKSQFHSSAVIEQNMKLTLDRLPVRQQDRQPLRCLRNIKELCMCFTCSVGGNF